MKFKLHRRALVLGFIVTLSLYAIGWAVTVSQVWQNVYDASNTALRVSQVAGS